MYRLLQTIIKLNIIHNIFLIKKLKNKKKNKKEKKNIINKLYKKCQNPLY